MREYIWISKNGKQLSNEDVKAMIKAYGPGVILLKNKELAFDDSYALAPDAYLVWSYHDLIDMLVQILELDDRYPNEKRFPRFLLNANEDPQIMVFTHMDQLRGRDATQRILAKAIALAAEKHTIVCVAPEFNWDSLRSFYRGIPDSTFIYAITGQYEQQDKEDDELLPF